MIKLGEAESRDCLVFSMACVLVASVTTVDVAASQMLKSLVRRSMPCFA